MITSTIKSMMNKIDISKYSPDQRDSPKAQYPTTMELSKRRDPPLDGGHSTKIGGIWTLKHDISS